MGTQNASGRVDVASGYGDALAVVPSDTAAQFFEELWVGGLGNVTVVTQRAQDDFVRNGTAVVPVLFSAVPAGTRLPVAVAKVMATGTTATLITGLR